jgi:purine-binding chemotaxis protein CheW
MQGEICAIPVSEPPNLIELPLGMMQLLPQSHSGLLRIASHAAAVTQDELTATLFLLDIKRILAPSPVLSPKEEQYY